MKPYHRVVLGNLASLLGVFVLLAAAVWLVGAVWAQAEAPESSASNGAIGGFAIAIAILGVLVAIGVVVKLFDTRRQREDEAAGLQGRIGDVLLTDPLLFGLVLTPLVQVPLRQGKLATVSISGTVPTPELREAALRSVMQTMEGSRTSFRIEDRITVDPLMSRHAA